MRDFFCDESGSTSAEVALLFPFILAIIMFALYINMFYESKIATSIGANEALRYAVTQTNYADAKSIANSRLQNVYRQHNITYKNMSLSYDDTNGDGKYSIGDILTLKVETKKGIWCNHTYTLQARVEDDQVIR
ncbi:MAG: TadE/TadG family type IV pilus assembly protein [Massilimicrobiota timonensis]